MCAPLIDVQIVNFDTYDFLVRCVASVYEDAERSNIPIAIHVADNASGDDIGKICYQFPEVSPHKLPCNLGYGAANNLLLDDGDAPFILVLNPDVVIQEEQTLERLLIWMREGAYHVVGPRLVTPLGDTQWWDHGDLGYGWRGALARKLGSSIYHPHHEPTEVAWVSGAFFLISRKAFSKVGGFDRCFFLYKEEEDLCLRLRRLGYKSLYDPTVSVFHHGSVVASKARCMTDSERLFIEKHCQGIWRYLARLRVFLKRHS